VFFGEGCGDNGFVSPCLRRVAVAWVLATTLALSGCGESNEQVAQTEPTIPRAVADDLANRAEEIARLLDEGDTCGAASEAHELRREAQQAIEKGDVPEPFRARIESAVADLQKIECTTGTGTSGTATGAETTAPTPTTATTTTAPVTTPTTTTAPETTTSEVTPTSTSG
jgi:hypothetical protein